MSKQEINIKAVEANFKALHNSYKDLWDAITYLAKEVLTCNQADKFSEYLNRDKKGIADTNDIELSELLKKFKTDPEPTAEELKCEWPSSGAEG